MINSSFISNQTLSTDPRIVDPCETGLWFVEDEEGGEVGGVRGDDDHGEPCPHHTQHTGRETAGRTLPYKQVK